MNHRSNPFTESRHFFILSLVKRLLLGASGWILLVLAGLQAVYFVAEGFWRPVLYEASAVVEIDGRGDSRNFRFTRKDMLFVSSTNVLYPVCQSLDLGKKWGQKYHADNLPVHDAYVFVWVGLVVTRPKDGRLMEISFFSDKTNEPPVVANAVAASLTNQWVQRNNITADEVRVRNATGIRQVNRWSVILFKIMKYAVPCGSIGIGLVFFSCKFPPLLPIPQNRSPVMSKY